MAVIYLRSTDGNDADNGSTWALAKATLAAALTAAGAGGTVYVSQAHAETQNSAMALNSPGTPSSPVNVWCVSDAAEPPTALATTATITTTGAFAITFSGSSTTTATCNYYGITFTSGSGATAANLNIGVSGSNINCILDSCKLVLGTSASTSLMILNSGSRGAKVVLNNTVLGFGAVGQGIYATAPVFWTNTSSAIDTGGSVPTTLIKPLGTDEGVVIENVDLSALGSGKNLVAIVGNGGKPVTRIINCKLGSDVTVLTGTIFGPGEEVILHNSDYSDTNYRMEHYKYQGSIKSEISKIRDLGASDGTTPLSWNMTSLAGASFVSPLDSPAITAWNESASQITVTVEIALDSAAIALNDDEIWIEVSYLGTSGAPLGVKVTDRKTDIFASAAAQNTSSVTWNNMTTPTRQKLSVTFTPSKKGVISAKVMLAKASTTVYVDPVLTIS